MKIAYILTQYPKVSHTFIREEILALEDRGVDVIRLAAQSNVSSLIDAIDHLEHSRTTVFSDLTLLSKLEKITSTVIRKPYRFVAVFVQCITEGMRAHNSVVHEIWYLVHALCFAAIVRRQNCGHIHAHFGTGSSATARRLASLAGLPFSFTGHAHDVFDSPRFRLVPEKVRDAKFVVGVSYYTVAQLYRWSDPSDWHKIRMIRCRPSEMYATKSDRLDSNSINFACVGRLNPQKGHLVLLRAFRMLLDSGFDAHLDIVGDGSFRCAIEQLSTELDLSANIHFLGALGCEGICDTLQKSRALVVPSFMEGLPMVIMEAYLQGRTVIATNVSGIPELVRDGVNGWLVSPGDAVGLANAMREVMQSDTKQLDNMANIGRRQIESEFLSAEGLNAIHGLFTRSVD